MERLSCSSSCKDVRNPIKLSSGCSKEMYLMRQKYLRSYPLMRSKEKEKFGGKAVKRAKKLLKEVKKKYEWRSDDRENKWKITWWRTAGDEIRKSSSSYVEACLKLMTVCMAKVDVARMPESKPRDKYVISF